MKDVGFLMLKLANFMELREILLDDGQEIIILSTKEIQATNVLILYLVKAINLLQNQNLKMNLFKAMCIVECHLVNNKMIWKDNVSFLKVNSQIISLLKTLAQDSIIKDQDFLSSWNFLIEKTLNKSWYQAKIDFVDLDLNSYSGNSYKTIQNSWFLNNVIRRQNKNSLKIFLPFYKYLLVDRIPNEDTLLRTKKIKLRLTSIQKRTLIKWSNHCRYTYNKAIDFITSSSSESFKNSRPENNHVYYSDFELRDLITPESVCSRIPWILETPKGIREQAVFEANKNLKSALSNLKNGHIKHFKLGFKSKKETRWAITIPSASIHVYNNKTVGLYEARTTNFRIRTTEQIDCVIKHDCKIHYDGINFYLCVPYETEMKTSNKNWFGALDPGIRKFQTVYCPDEEEYIKIADKSSLKLYKNLLSLDNLLSKKNAKNTLKIKRLRIRIENLQKELHSKVANFLCHSYQNIYIPKLTKQNDIIKRDHRKLKTETVRRMVVFAHSKFVERLKTKAKEFTNVQIHVIGEEYTSQKCLNCNGLTKTSNEWFCCDYCDFKIDRDILGSTNILLKNW